MATPLKDPGRLDPAFTWSSLERASDERLVALARGGLDVAVEAIVRRYHTTLMQHASRFLDPTRAETAVQEALVKGFVALEGDRKRIHLRSWLFRIVQSEAVNVARRRSGSEEARDQDEGEAESAEYRARVERLRNIIVGVNRPDAAYAEAVDKSREDVARDLAETRAGIEVLMQRARASMRAAGGTLLPRLQLRSWFEKLGSPAMGGVVRVGAAAAVVVVVAGAAALSTNRGDLDSGSTQPSASSAPDSKPRVAGPRREGGTRTTADEPKRAVRKDSSDRAAEPAPASSPPELTPTVSGGGPTPTAEPAPKHGKKPKKSKPSDEADSGEDVIVLGEKKGTTSPQTGATTAP